MYLKQADLFNGLNMPFVREVMDITVQESHPQGAILFHAGDHSDFFFILIKGCVRLTTEAPARKVYIGDHTGEFFGWSGLVGRGKYSVKAECMEPTTLLRIDIRQFQTILDRDAANGILFYRNLCGALGKRLMNVYQLIPESSD